MDRDEELQINVCQYELTLLLNKYPIRIAMSTCVGLISSAAYELGLSKSDLLDAIGHTYDFTCDEKRKIGK